MEILERNLAAEALERYLGDPLNNASDLSFYQSLVDDESENFPARLYQALNDWGLSEYYVPRAYGGCFNSFEELLSIIKVVARRDLTAAIAHSAIYLGAGSVWLSGSDDQRRILAKTIKAGGAIAFGLTEKDHGSDILANEVTAKADAGGYRLSGEKWLINNATRSAAVVVFAKTRAEGGPRGFSLFLVLKDQADPNTYRCLPKIKTHGIRGADISGIGFDECFVPSSALIGAPGTGLESTLKMLQVTRTMCAALALGAANTALHAVLGFAASRRLYGGNLLKIPVAQRIIVDAFLDILICDCMAIAAARGLHVMPGQFSVWSSVIKYFVPVTIENAIRNLSTVLGARYYLREGSEAVFQKVLRDNAIISLFDGNTAVNLQAIALQLRFYFGERSASDEAVAADVKMRRELLFDIGKHLPDFDPKGLELFNHGRDDVVDGIASCLDYLQESSSAAIVSQVRNLAHVALDSLASLKSRAQKMAPPPGAAVAKSPALFGLAKEYCVVHAAATCLQIWTHSRTSLSGYFAAGEWLLLALNRLLKPDSPPDTLRSYFENAARELVEMHGRKEFISITPFRTC